MGSVGLRFIGKKILSAGLGGAAALPGGDVQRLADPDAAGIVEDVLIGIVNQVPQGTAAVLLLGDAPQRVAQNDPLGGGGGGLGLFCHGHLGGNAGNAAGGR